MTFGPHVPSHGPSPARIVLLAEAPGAEESAQFRPLVGPSGWELKRMLSTIGVSIDDCRKINVFSRQPEGNALHLYSTNELGRAYTDLGHMAANPAVYMDIQHHHELERTYREIAECNPNILIALGNTACWALGLGLGINALRGSVHTTTIPGLPRPLKVLPTYHPAMILRQWDLRVVALADLEKALIESAYPDLRFDNTELWLNPTLADLEEFDQRFMVPATECACDIETKRGQIDFICFTPNTGVSLSIPFWVEGPSPNYWPTPQEELLAWRFAHKWLERRDLVKIFQNGVYDLSYIPTTGCRPMNCSDDTMLAAHSCFSELQKGLGFLGSIHCNFPSWKKMNTFKKEELLKRDD